MKSLYAAGSIAIVIALAGLNVMADQVPPHFETIPVSWPACSTVSTSTLFTSSTWVEPGDVIDATVTSCNGDSFSWQVETEGHVHDSGTNAIVGSYSFIDANFPGDSDVRVYCDNLAVDCQISVTADVLVNTCDPDGVTVAIATTDEVLTITDGSLTDSNYRTNVDCSWTVDTSATGFFDTVVSYRFTRFSTEEDWDVLSLSTSFDDVLLSGALGEFQTTTNGDNPTLRFETDDTITGTGFRVEITVSEGAPGLALLYEFRWLIAGGLFLLVTVVGPSALGAALLVWTRVRSKPTTDVETDGVELPPKPSAPEGDDTEVDQPQKSVDLDDTEL